MIYCMLTRKEATGTVTEKYLSESVEDTEKIGAVIAGKLLAERPGRLLFIMLEGSLGAGKTALTRGIASVLSPGSRVTSPSYTIVNEYRLGSVPLFHFDLYRLGDGADLGDIGFDEYVSCGHSVVEWSEYLATDVPEDAVTVKITPLGEDRRDIEVIF